MKKIIMVDDDLEILNVFKVSFERAGYSITVFNNSASIFNNEFDEPDLFIIDKQLNGISGLDLCSYLKHRDHANDTPVIIFSASTQIRQQALNAGADDFIEKPFKTQTLLDMVEKLTK